MEDEIRKPVTIIDGMAIVCKTRVHDRTFAQLVDAVLQTVIALGESSDVIHLVFDVYQDESIKNAEQVRRGDGSLVFQKLVPTQVVKQWNSFLSSSKNKCGLIRFFVNHWKKLYMLLLMRFAYFLRALDINKWQLCNLIKRKQIHACFFI